MEDDGSIRSVLRSVRRGLALVVLRPWDAIRFRRWIGRRTRRLLGKEPAAGALLPLGPATLRFCRPLTRPRFVPAAEAGHMRDDDVVLGVVVEAEARAYPWWILDDHHVANDVVAGRPITVLLCEVCSSGLAYDPVVDGRVLTFGQRHLYNGTITLDDDQTGSVWYPVTATAVAGELEGTTLRLLPLSQMEWRVWRELHPDTLVLAAEHGSRTGHGSGHRIGSPRVGPNMRESIAHWDERLPHNTLVMTVSSNGASRTYPLSTLRDKDGVVNDELGGAPIVVLHHLAEGSFAALAFSRTAGGHTLTFRPGHRGPIDAETGSVWTYEGRAVEGPLAGTQLEFLPSHVSEWYIIGTAHPGIEIRGQRSG
ncbi:MAG TPA: DUF3179 domain-containing (seleno)protein [Actinomycetota bacterium]|nr:DUF3179 domain-containing (seleno)protein [Actinomycetota bacterium]